MKECSTRVISIAVEILRHVQGSSAPSSLPWLARAAFITLFTTLRNVKIPSGEWMFIFASLSYLYELLLSAVDWIDFSSHLGRILSAPPFLCNQRFGVINIDGEILEEEVNEVVCSAYCCEVMWI